MNFIFNNKTKILSTRFNHKFQVTEDKKYGDYVAYTCNLKDEIGNVYLFEIQFNLNTMDVVNHDGVSLIDNAPWFSDSIIYEDWNVKFKSKKYEDNSICKTTLIKPVTKELTLSEIEKQLGYKIKIVNESEGK